MQSSFLVLCWKKYDLCCQLGYKGTILENYVAVIKLHVTEFIGFNKQKAQMWISGTAGSSNSHYVIRTQILFTSLIQFCLC